MDDILQSIGDAIHDFFVDVCGGMFIGIFDDANAATGDIASQVGLTPSQWNGSIFSFEDFQYVTKMNNRADELANVGIDENRP